MSPVNIFFICFAAYVAIGGIVVCRSDGNNIKLETIVVRLTMLLVAILWISCLLKLVNQLPSILPVAVQAIVGGPAGIGGFVLLCLGLVGRIGLNHDRNEQAQEIKSKN